MSNTTKRPSLARAFLLHCCDMEGAITSKGEFRKSTPDQSINECKRYGRDRYKAAVVAHGGLRAAIDATCFGCAAVGDDPGGINLIRDCKCLRCPLHAVRPTKQIKGRRKLGSAE